MPGSPETAVLLVRAPGIHEKVFRPGGVYRIGRHAANDVVIDHSTVSRFHVRLTWAKSHEFPQVRDEGSQNGTRLNGQELEGAVDVGEGVSVLQVGKVDLDLEYCPTAALLETGESGDGLALFSDQGPELSGELTEKGAKQVMRKLELARRTGTLMLGAPRDVIKLTFYMGKVMGALGPKGEKGLAAAKQALAFPEGTPYRFVRFFKPGDEPIGRYPSDLVRLFSKS